MVGWVVAKHEGKELNKRKRKNKTHLPLDQERAETACVAQGTGADAEEGRSTTNGLGDGGDKLGDWDCVDSSKQPMIYTQLATRTDSPDVCFFCSISLMFS